MKQAPLECRPCYHTEKVGVGAPPIPDRFLAGLVLFLFSARCRFGDRRRAESLIQDLIEDKRRSFGFIKLSFRHYSPQPPCSAEGRCCQGKLPFSPCRALLDLTRGCKNCRCLYARPMMNMPFRQILPRTSRVADLRGGSAQIHLTGVLSTETYSRNAMAPP